MKGKPFESVAMSNRSRTTIDRLKWGDGPTGDGSTYATNTSNYEQVGGNSPFPTQADTRGI